MLGEEAVASHHGSLARQMRLDAEQRLKAGEAESHRGDGFAGDGHRHRLHRSRLPDRLAAAPSPTFLQRVGRSGHSLGALPKGRLFPLTRDELIEWLALIRRSGPGKLDRIEIPESPLDILAQQIVAAVACEEWEENELFKLCRRAYPYRNLSRQDYDDIIKMLTEA